MAPVSMYPGAMFHCNNNPYVYNYIFESRPHLKVQMVINLLPISLLDLSTHAAAHRSCDCTM